MYISLSIVSVYLLLLLYFSVNKDYQFSLVQFSTVQLQLSFVADVNRPLKSVSDYKTR